MIARTPSPPYYAVSYWESLEAIRQWKAHSEHLIAQQQGRTHWYTAYKTRICRVERDYEFGGADFVWPFTGKNVAD